LQTTPIRWPILTHMPELRPTAAGTAVSEFLAWHNISQSAKLP